MIYVREPAVVIIEQRGRKIPKIDKLLRSPRLVEGVTEFLKLSWCESGSYTTAPTTAPCLWCHDVGCNDVKTLKLWNSVQRQADTGITVTCRSVTRYSVTPHTG